LVNETQTDHKRKPSATIYRFGAEEQRNCSDAEYKSPDCQELCIQIDVEVTNTQPNWAWSLLLDEG
jgi:hypothetical protein